MNYLLYALFFAAGIAIAFFLYKKRLGLWRDALSKKLESLLANGGKSMDGSGASIQEKIPGELDAVLERLQALAKAVAARSTQSAGQTEPMDSGKQEFMKKTVDNLYIVNELGQKVTSSLNLDQSFQHLYTTINSMMDAAVLELRVLDESTGEMKLFTNVEAGKDSAVDDYPNIMSDWCFKNNREIFLPDAEKNFGRYVFQQLILPDGRVARSVIAFPIINRGRVSGTLCVISFRPNSYAEYHQDIIRLLLGYIAVAIENALRHEELHKLKIRAERSEKFKEQFLANMSHEIRTPINAVTGMTSLLLERDPRADQLRYLESISKASDSLLVIINDILDLSKIEAGKIELEQIDFSLADLIRNVKDIMHFRADEKGLVFEEETDPNVPPVLIGDPTRLTQILINLVGNAIKFTSKGTVKVTARKIGASKTNGENEARILFEVADTGIGMTEEQQGRLFQDYAQATTETARKYGGTGLGLSISRQLVQLQGGDIGVESKLGEGSRFYFTLTFPVSRSTSIQKLESVISSDMLKELKGMSVLLADDNEYNRIVVMETLQLKIGEVNIDEALDGSQALEMVRRNDYDIILMDLIMPNMDGLEATRLIRKEVDPKKKSIPILALTASVVKSEIDKCFEAGMDGFIPKPFKSFELLNEIYKVLKGKAGLEEAMEIHPNQGKPKGKYVDLNVLNDFMEGDEVRMKRHIDLFLTKTPANLEEVSKALKRADYETIRITVHSMKPQLQMAGVNSGLELAQEIESHCREKSQLEMLPDLIGKLKEICENAISELRQLVA